MPGQHIVIVGGSSGIGLATARLLAEQGQKVTICGRDRGRLARAGDTLGGGVTTLAMDAADPNSIAAGFAAIGAFDHLVLALGSGKGVGPFATIPLAEVRQGFEEKVYAHFACAQAALPTLGAEGSIVFVAAVTAHAAMPGLAAIGAANAAIASLVPTLAMELKPRRVNAVSPGIIDTPWWDFLSTEQKGPVFDSFAVKSPVGRVGRPDDVAQAIGFLIADRFVTGHILHCDGGLRLAG